jgi:hypothetical protein
MAGNAKHFLPLCDVIAAAMEGTRDVGCHDDDCACYSILSGAHCPVADNRPDP